MRRFITKRIYKAFSFVLRRMGYEVTKSKNVDDIFLTNVFKTEYDTNVLISYIISPFKNGSESKAHTNHLECYTAAEAFKNLRFNVDVIMYNENYPVDYSKYKVIYGIGVPLENSFYSEYAGAICRIIYSPGCNTYFSIPQSTLRAYSFFKEKGIYMLDSARLDGFYASQSMLVDLIITLGNDFVANTYRTMNPEIRVEKINAFYHDVCNPDLNLKNYKNTKQHFLWFGSSGAIHKGLDIAIDYFAEQNDLHLHICGNAHLEEKFWNYYRPVVESKNNIHYYGFVDINSAQFQTILNTCLFVVYPSISEGGSPSVLNVTANGGLIPIISKNAGIDVENGHGWIFDDISVKGLSKAIDKVLSMDEESLKEISIKVKDYFRYNYSYNQYKSRLNSLIQEVADKTISEYNKEFPSVSR